ncbi:MAG: serine protease, partial [Bdellovibrionaceae bacterium]|nr:serine protease [Pseudobdellovibrionaceae bacterium]
SEFLLSEIERILSEHTDTYVRSPEFLLSEIKRILSEHTDIYFRSPEFLLSEIERILSKYTNTYHPKPTFSRTSMNKQLYNDVVEQTVVRLHATKYDNDKNLILVMGTGFFISPNIVATAYHLLEGSEKVYFNDYIDERNRQIYLKVLSVDEKSDLALLQMESGQLNKEYKGLDINNYDLPDRIKKEESITAIGFPETSFTEIKGNLITSEDFIWIYFKEGMSRKEAERFNKPFARRLIYFIAYLFANKEFSDILKKSSVVKKDLDRGFDGLSGSPVFSKEGELLGIWLGSLSDSIGYYASIERLRDLVRKALGNDSSLLTNNSKQSQSWKDHNKLVSQTLSSESLSALSQEMKFCRDTFRK